jgi:hypothetical protein
VALAVVAGALVVAAGALVVATGALVVVGGACVVAIVVYAASVVTAICVASPVVTEGSAGARPQPARRARMTKIANFLIINPLFLLFYHKRLHMCKTCTQEQWQGMLPMVKKISLIFVRFTTMPR